MSTEDPGGPSQLAALRGLADPSVPLLCPRCGTGDVVTFGSSTVCQHCGATWQERAPEPVCPACGVLCWTDGVRSACRHCGGAGRPAEPALSPRERYAARRSLDERAER
jgi:hypothetical protein